MTSACEHVESVNPRQQGWCVKCSKPMPETLKARQRDLDLEREITRHAARGYANPERIIEIAEFRASSASGEYVTDPMLLAPGKDWVHEAREELVDARNYLTWWLCENVGNELAESRLRALRCVLLAFQELEDED